MMENEVGIDVNALNSAREELQTDISARRSRLASLIEILDPLEIMLRSAWYSRFLSHMRFINMGDKDERDVFDELYFNNANLVPEFLQSCLLFIAARGESSNADSSATSRLEETIACAESIIDVLNQAFLVRYSDVHIAGKNAGLSDDVIRYQIESKTYQSLRGRRYQAIEEDYLTLLLSKQDDLIKEVYGIGATDVINGFVALMTSLTLGWSAACNELGKQYDNWQKEPLRSFDGISKDEAARIANSVFGTALHDVAAVTQWPESLIEDLSLSAASVSDFEKVNSIDPPGIMPIVDKPFIRINGISYCFCVANFLDHFYRSFYRAIRSRFIASEVGSSNEFISRWKESQASASEDGVAALFKKLLPGSTICINGYHPRNGAKWNKRDVQESDLVILYEDALLAVEVKAGAFCPTDPVDDSKGHIKSFQGLLEKASRQAESTAAYFRSCSGGPCRFYDARGKVKVEFSSATIRTIFKICVTVDDLNEFASKADKLEFIKMSKDTIALSLDDLFVYTRYFNNPLVFLHYLAQRRSAASMPALYMNDELDHLGMYIDNNCYTQTLERQVRDSGPDINNNLNFRIQGFFGFRDKIDDWFNSLYIGAVAEKPVQSSPKLFDQIVEMLDDSSLGYWRRAIASTLLNCGSDTRKAVSDGIATRLKPGVPSDLRLDLPAQEAADVPLCIFVNRDNMPNDDEICRGKCLAVLMHDAAPNIVRLDINASDGKIKSLCINEYRLDNLSEEDKAYAAGFIPALDRTRKYCIKKQVGRKIGRNELCPCGSGKKYKKCCGR